jgi:hypothetical protein
VAFSAGVPVAPSNSSASYTFIMRNADNTQCPQNCFRPVGLAFDSKGRLFMSSDKTGEIYMVTSEDGGSIDSKTLNVTTAGPPAKPPPKKSGAWRVGVGGWVGWLVVMAGVVSWS